MSAAVIPYVLPLGLAAVLIGGLAFTAWPQRSLPGVRWFLVFSGALVVWSLAYAAELLAPSVGGKILTAKVQYLGIAVVPVAWLAFALDYSGASRRSKGLIAALMTVPVATLVVAWTNELHGLLWSSVELTAGLPYTVLNVSYGPWFWVHFACSYVYLLVATGLLIRVIFVRPPLFRRQATLLLLACLSPWLGNVIYVTGMGPESLDLTVFGFSLSGLLAGWAILRWKLLAIGPIARDTIVEGMSEAMAVVDREGRLVDVNPAAVDVLGTPVDGLIGWDAREVLGPFAGVLDKEEGLRHPMKGPGGQRTYDCQLDRLTDGRGRLRGWTIVLHDVTDRAAESAALQQAREMADETARAQRAFLANMNHELRTPLNGVMGMLQILLTTGLDDEQRSYAQTANDSADELLRLLARIMDFTTLESGRIVLEQVPFSPTTAVEEALSEARGAARTKGLAFMVDTRSDIPRQLVGDPKRVQQVISTLADNAVKFTESGSVSVSYSADTSSGEEARLRVEVKDTGIGIPEDRLGAIFDGFVQVDVSSTRRHEGAGLGLSIAHRLVARMGGALKVESEVGTGTRFWFTVPLRVAETESLSS